MYRILFSYFKRRPYYFEISAMASDRRVLIGFIEVILNTTSVDTQIRLERDNMMISIDVSRKALTHDAIEDRESYAKELEQ